MNIELSPPTSLVSPRQMMFCKWSDLNGHPETRPECPIVARYLIFNNLVLIRGEHLDILTPLN